MDKLHGLIHGDRRTVELIYQDHLEDVIQWIENRGGDRSIALDIFQDALEVIMTISLKPDFTLNNTFGGYLFGICKIKWFKENKLRQKNSEVRNGQSHTHLEVEEIELTPALDTEMLLQQTLTRLSPICQRLMIMIKSNLSTDQIVTELKFSNSNTMYRRKFACMKRWKTIIENDDMYIKWKSSTNG